MQTVLRHAAGLAKVSGGGGRPEAAYNARLVHASRQCSFRDKKGNTAAATISGAQALIWGNDSQLVEWARCSWWCLGFFMRAWLLSSSNILSPVRLRCLWTQRLSVLLLLDETQVPLTFSPARAASLWIAVRPAWSIPFMASPSRCTRQSREAVLVTSRRCSRRLFWFIGSANVQVQQKWYEVHDFVGCPYTKARGHFDHHQKTFTTYICQGHMSCKRIRKYVDVHCTNAVGCTHSGLIRASYLKAPFLQQ